MGLDVFLWAASERGGSNVKYFEDFHPEDGSSLGQNLALAAFIVPDFLESDEPFEVLPLS